MTSPVLPPRRVYVLRFLSEKNKELPRRSEVSGDYLLIQTACSENASSRLLRCRRGNCCFQYNAGLAEYFSMSCKQNPIERLRRRVWMPPLEMTPFPCRALSRGLMSAAVITVLHSWFASTTTQPSAFSSSLVHRRWVGKGRGGEEVSVNEGVVYTI